MIFIVNYFSGEKGETKHIENELNPVWQEVGFHIED